MIRIELWEGDDNPTANLEVVLDGNDRNERVNLNNFFDEAAREPRDNFPSVKIDFKEKDRLSTGSNYDVCTIKMKGFLSEANLWEFVDDTIPRPPRERNLLSRDLEPEGDIHKE